MLTTLPHARAGKLRIIGLTSAKRSPAYPISPPSRNPECRATNLFVVWRARSRETPAAIVQRINGELEKALRQPDVIEKLASQGVDTYYSTPEQFAARIKEEIPKWAKVLPAAGCGPNEG